MDKVGMIRTKRMLFGANGNSSALYADADGVQTGNLDPQDDAERAHFAAMLMRMDEAYNIL